MHKIQILKIKIDNNEDCDDYIKECYDNNKDKHVYIDADLCYYNFLQGV